MANLNRKWYPWLAAGCVHGHLQDREAVLAVLTMKDRLKPKLTIDLGDNVDLSPFRSGAHGTKDEAVDLEGDLRQGIRFIKDFRPNRKLNGNHDWRLWKNANHHQAIIAKCSREIIDDIRKALPKDCQFVESYNINQSWIEIGGTKFLHGFMYNENALRDHAEQYGRCVIAHLHKVGQAKGRHFSRPSAYCVGMLGDPKLFEYAGQRRATSQWSQGFAWGEYCDDWCEVNLCERGEAGWRLPI